MEAWNQSRNRRLAQEVERAHSFWPRFRGLMLRRALPPGRALWLRPCRQVHMFWMRFAIDLLYLDGEGRVLALVENLRPWRVAPACRGAVSCLELPAGTIAATGTRVGDRVQMQ